MRSRYLAALIMMLWAAGGHIPSKAAPEGVALAPRMAPGEAAAALLLMRNDFHCTFRSQEQRHGRQTSILAGSTANIIKVDQKTGLIVEYTPKDVTGIGSGASGSPSLTAEDAVARATAFLQTTGVKLEGLWTLTESSYHEQGPSDRYYDVTWRKIFHGIELPSFIDVLVDADDGQVRSYMLIDDPVVVPLQANLTGEQALAVVAEKKGWTHPILKKAKLDVWYAGGYPGPQALLWSFEIANPDATRGSDSYVWADVNATTGEVVRLDGPAGFFGPMPKGQKAVSVALPKPDLKALRGAKPPPTVFQLAKLREGKKAAGEKAK